MSTAAFPLSLASVLISTTIPPPNPFAARPEPPARRRGSFAQGRALETLAHAIEYLSDSRMFDEGESVPAGRAETEAIRIMTRASRAVFEECPETIPLHRRVGRWLSERMGSPTA
jgi:hypothetical protein